MAIGNNYKPLPCEIVVNKVIPTPIVVSGKPGKEAAVLYGCCIPFANLQVKANGRHFSLPDPLEAQRAGIIEKNKGNSNFRDGELWRADSITVCGDKVSFELSEATYSQLATVRGKSLDDLIALLGPSLELKVLPNLFTTYGVFITTDGYLVVALRDGRNCDQFDITGVPAGFLDRRGHEAPLSVKEGTLVEAKEELSAVCGTGIITGDDCIDWEASRFLGTTYSLGPVWDVTNHSFLRGIVAFEDLRIPTQNGKPEHQVFLGVPASKAILREVLERGSLPISRDDIRQQDQPFEGVKQFALSGACLVSIWRLLDAMEKGALDAPLPTAQEIKYCKTFVE